MDLLLQTVHYLKAAVSIKLWILFVFRGLTFLARVDRDVCTRLAADFSVVSKAVSCTTLHV